MKNKVLYSGKWNDDYISNVSSDVDFSVPSTFVRYGLAEEYYKKSFDYILETYPHDGSWYEKRKWFENLMPWDRYVVNNMLPKSSGYIIFSDFGLSDIEANYGNHTVFSPKEKEYILFYGGPHRYGDEFSDANVVSKSNYRGSNLTFGKSNTIEFFLKRGNTQVFTTDERTCILDVWNQEPYTSSENRRMIIGIQDNIIIGYDAVYINFYFASFFYQVNFFMNKDSVNLLRDDKWHFYSIVVEFVKEDNITQDYLYVKMYVDGEFFQEEKIFVGFYDYVDKNLVASIGAFLGEYNIDTAGMPRGAGRIRASIDEFRFWHYARSEDDIRLFSQTNVFGGTNSDDENIGLGVYYKFNEGVTFIDEIDNKILDYSGRRSDGVFYGYKDSNRSVESAFNEFYEKIVEEGDIIIRKQHPDIVYLYEHYLKVGQEYDTSNPYNVYKLFPSAFVEEYDSQELKIFCQIIGSFFDYMLLIAKNLHFDAFSSLGEGETYPIHYYKRFLDSVGLKITDLFSFSEWYEFMLGISDEVSFSSSIEKIKRVLLSTISSNAVLLLKSRGTLNSLISALNVFGNAEDVISIKKYSLQKYTNTSGTVEANKYYRSRCVSSDNDGKITITNKSSTPYLGQLYIDTPSDARKYAHTWICEFEMSHFSSIPGRTSVFGAYDLENDESVFDVFFDFLGYDNSGIFVIDFPFLSFHRSCLVRNDENISRRNILSVQIYNKNYYNNLVDNDNEYWVKFSMYRENDGLFEEVFSFEQSIQATDIDNLFDGRKLVFYCGAKRLNNAGELSGNVIMETLCNFFDFRYVLFPVDSEYIKSVYSRDRGVSAPFVYWNNWNSKYNFYNLNAFVWNFNYILEDKPYYFSLINNSDVLTISTDGCLRAIAGMFPYMIVHESDSVMSLVKDRYYSGLLFERSEDSVHADNVMFVENYDTNRFYKYSKNFSNFYTIEKSLAKILDSEFFSLFVDLGCYYSYFNCNAERYSYEYKVLPFVRNQFFNIIGKDLIDYNSFFMYYKWLDDAIYDFLRNFVSEAAIKKDVFSVVCGHSVEREKIPQKRIKHIFDDNVEFYYAFEDIYHFNAKEVVLPQSSIKIRLLPSYYRYSYDYVNTNGRSAQSRFYIMFKGYKKDYYKLPSSFLRVFYDLEHSPLNYERCYRNFVTEQQRKKHHCVFVNQFNNGLLEESNNLSSDERSMEFSSSSCVVFRNVKTRKELNYIWGGTTI